MNVVVYGDFNCLLCYLASQRADQLAGTGAAGIEWRAVERGTASARWEQEVAQAEALALPGERLPAAPPPALSSTAAAVAAYAEAITDGIQDELRRRLFDAIWARRQNLSSAYDVRRVVTSITWPAPPVYFHLTSPDLPLPLLHDPDPVRIVRRSGGTVTLGRRAADHHRIPAMPGLAGAVAGAAAAGHPGSNRAGRHGSRRRGRAAVPGRDHGHGRRPARARTGGAAGACPGVSAGYSAPAGRPVSCRGAGSGSERAALGRCPRAAPARPGNPGPIPSGSRSRSTPRPKPRIPAPLPSRLLRDAG